VAFTLHPIGAKIVSKHDLRLVKKVVYLRSTCGLTVLNMGSKLDLHQLKKDIYWSSTLTLYVMIKAKNMTTSK